MANKNKSNKIEIVFLLYEIILTAIISISVIYSLIFLSGKLFHAFYTDGKTTEGTKYNIEEFKKLGF